MAEKEDDVIREPHKACYGTMLPARVEGRAGETYRGKAMSLTIVAPGGLGPATRRVDVDPDEWDDCLRCHEFDHCHKLCTARLALLTAGSV